MKHELIMENWRKYLAEQEQKAGSGLLSNDPKQREFARLIAKDKEKWKSQAKERERKADWRTQVRALVMTFDPTGFVGDIDAETGKVTPQYDLVKKAGNESAKAWNDGNYVEAGLSAGDTALQAMAMIPVLGKIPKFGSKMVKGLAQAKKVSKELKKTGESSLVKKAKEIDNTIEKIKIPQASRLRSYISGIQKQINQKALSAIRKGSFKVGQTKTYKVPKPKDSKLELDEVSVEILPMKPDQMSGNRKVLSDADYGADALDSGKGVGGDIDIKIYVHPRFVKDGVVSKYALGDVHRELNKTGFHEMMHARQAKKNLKGSKAPEDQFPSAEKIQNRSYRDYRLDPQEIAAHAQDAATSIGKVSETGIDTLDRMAQSVRPEFSSFDDLVAFNNPVYIETIKAQLAYALKNIPCAAISAANVFELEALGIFDTSNLSQKNQNIINTGSRKKSIVVNPKNCAAKLMERIIQEEITKKGIRENEL